MTKEIKCENLDDAVLIDVRSPKEYSEAHITNAINLPILTDEERAHVGYVYKNANPEEAKLLAVKYGSNKVSDIFQKFVSLYSNNKKIIFYCARGGMRSEVIASIIDSLGYKVYKLEGGFKAYRNFIVNSLPRVNEDVKYIVLHGKTGVGKTKLLNKLKHLNYDVLNLEEGANHRGSILGSVGLGKSNSQKYFETYIYENLKNRKNNLVFVEDESKRVGNAFIPDSVANSMKNGYHILIEMPMEERIRILKDEYLGFENVNEEIKECILQLDRRLGKNFIDKLSELLDKKNYDELAQILNEKYYDPLYEKSIKQYEFDLILHVNSIEKALSDIIEFFNKIKEIKPGYIK